MSLYRQAYEIRNNILNTMTNNLSKIEGSYNYDIATSVALELETSYTDVRDLWVELFPWSCTKEPYLSYHMTTFGLSRKGATFSEGEVQFTGDTGAIIPKGTKVTSRTFVQYQTIENGVINGNGKVIVKIEALKEGVEGNCGIGDIVNFEIGLSGVARVTNLKPITGGALIESLESCKSRMKDKASLPAHSGNKSDYKKFMKEISDVGKVTVIGAGEYNVPAGNVHIYFGTEEGKIPTNEAVQNAQAYIDDDRKPIGAMPTVKPFEALTTNITIAEVRVVSGSITKEQFIEKLKTNIAVAYNTPNFLTNDIIPVSRMVSLAYSVDASIVLIDNLFVNGSPANIRLLYNQLPIMGTVEVTSFVEDVY